MKNAIKCSAIIIAVFTIIFLIIYFTYEWQKHQNKINDKENTTINVLPIWDTNLKGELYTTCIVYCIDNNQFYHVTHNNNENLLVLIQDTNELKYYREKYIKHLDTNNYTMMVSENYKKMPICR